MKAAEHDLLTIELAPRRRDELQIHNKKIAEVDHWLKNVFSESNKQLGVMYLTGPAGSGKSTTVEVMCTEQNIEIIEYSPEYLHNEDFECEKPDFTQLRRFLLRRHGSLRGGGLKKRLLLVTELPDQAYSDAEKFREDLSEVLQHIWHPVIFCLTNSIACWNLNPDRLFTKDFNIMNGIDTVTFNPVADSFMKKALVRASNCLSSPLSDAKLNVIGEEAGGDLRIAMNMLQMNSIGPNADRRSGNSVICASKANREEAFHMIGRILYAKRVNPNVPKPSRFSKRRRKSAPIPEPLVRTELEHDPTDIITMSSMTSEKLLDFLFQNEPIFCSNISKYRYVAETFSMCDFLTGDWTTRKSLPEDYVAQMATRSVMWNNYKEPRPGTLFAVGRPLRSSLEKHIARTKLELQRLPMIGAKDYAALTCPYITIIKDIIDPQRIEYFLSRPMDINWQWGNDKIEEHLEKQYALDYKGRKKHRLPLHKAPKPSGKIIEVVDLEEEEEKFTIEESSDDSFEEF